MDASVGRKVWLQCCTPRSAHSPPLTQMNNNATSHNHARTKKKVVQSNLQKWPFCAAAASRLCIFWSNIIKLMLFVGSIRVEWSLSVLTFSWTQTSKCKYMLQSCLIWLLSLRFLVRLLAWWVGSSLPVLSITSCCTRDNLLRCKSAARLSGLCLLLGFTAKPVCCPKLRD